MSRPSKEHYLMSLALLAAQRASCPRRKVGCVLVNGDYHVVSTGYNGPPKGMVNCTDIPCGGQHHASGQGLNSCVAIHAEINAFEQAGNRLNTVVEMYLTCGPCCPLCTEQFLKLYSDGQFSSLQRIYYFDNYPSDTAKIFEALDIELINLGKNLEKDSMLYKLAVLLGFRKEELPYDMVLCVGGPLNGQMIRYSGGSFMRANLTNCSPDDLNPMYKFESNNFIDKTVDIVEYYQSSFRMNKFSPYLIFRYSKLDDTSFHRLLKDLIALNPQLRFL